MNFEIQRTFYYNIRSRICGWLNESTKVYYTKWFKNKSQSWNINMNDLENLNTNTLGNHLFRFLKSEGFTILDKHESHDIFHVLTNYSTTKEEEIAMQYCLFGNGRRTPYMALSIFVGTCLLPENITLFYKAYLKGKQAFPFHQINYKHLLNTPLYKLQFIFNIQE